jgi:hypothetical protein
MRCSLGLPAGPGAARDRDRAVDRVDLRHAAGQVVQRHRWRSGRWLVTVAESPRTALRIVAALSSAVPLTKRVPTIALILGAALCGALVAHVLESGSDAGIGNKTRTCGT